MAHGDRSSGPGKSAPPRNPQGLQPAAGNFGQAGQLPQHQQQAPSYHPQYHPQGPLQHAPMGGAPQQPQLPYHHYYSPVPFQPAPASAPGSAQVGTPSPALGPGPSATAPSPAKRPTATPTASSSPSHVCHICRRVYERADHLTRHLRSHENARPYQCSRCPKRFNRADLLTRHEATHDRDGSNPSAKPRSFIRRSDRAAEACENCSTSKSKCDDKKPCTRCRTKGLPCHPASRRGMQYRTSEASDSMTPPDTAATSSSNPTSRAGYARPAMSLQPPGNYSHVDAPGEVEATAFMQSPAMGQQPMHGGYGEGMFFSSTYNPLQDMDFTWDMNLEEVVIPNMGPSERSSQSSGTPSSKHSSKAATRDHSKGYAAFKRSPWLWEPETSDGINRAREGLALSDETIAASSAFRAVPKASISHVQIPAAVRDTMFAMVIGQQPMPPRIPSFPTLELLNSMAQAHFIQNAHSCDSWMHLPSFHPAEVLPELLMATISYGASFISVPAIWRFGHALQEVVRIALGIRFDSNNSATRDLESIQAWMLILDLGQYCGFSRKMEIAECFLQPIVTMLRRANKLTLPVESDAMMPRSADKGDALQVKWKSFIQRESWKRLALHMFFHDAQSSIGICKPPIMTFNELSFTAPASRDLWEARTAEDWRDAFVRKGPPPFPIPRVSELMNSKDLLEEARDHIDSELCYMALLFGYWGQVHALREAAAFYKPRSSNSRVVAHHQWMKMQQQELYRDLRDFSHTLQQKRKQDPQMQFYAELLMMIMYISPDELQRFAGKHGEEEAARAAQYLDEVWSDGPDYRYATWHAGQVIRHARRLAPTKISGFNAMTVYLASLTLWAYSLVARPRTEEASPKAKTIQHAGPLLVDGDDARGSTMFMQNGHGTPSLRVSAEPNAAVEALSNSGVVLSIAQRVLRDNFPVRGEPLPPLVESLARLLVELGSGIAGRNSEASDEDSDDDSDGD